MVEGGKTKVSSNEQPFHSRKETAKEIGVSSTTFERAKKVIELASPKLKEQVRSGQTSIN
ncbi:hypothetical protein AAA799E16_01753 [Marine Group I thaumarchaeote SCGC AAA799-E16]|uniref:Uncharacterized protein n=2 Tax=Marine Group I TaxID=905826 RepID=A0A087RXJ3_9ARCH|nr:hypothetical protein AAA799E16_01753 [Marine Group I thaumarchaeote SCGC AAA799-E16]KFM18197.1 hypothetical protein SCCGRSA3_01267 [Marine Group I thaumarchaeote SCGC RSA3]